MNNKEFCKLKVGDKVRIVSKKKGDFWNSCGDMDKWLGKVMTILSINVDKTRCYACMEEDMGDRTFRDGWAWYPHMIAEKVQAKEVKRVANVGEYIKIVDPCMTFGHYSKGDVLKIVRNDGHHVYADVGANYPVFIYNREYVVLENYIPDDKPNKVETKEKKQPTIVKHLVRDRKTIVKLSNGKVGIAVCSPEDEFDIYEGLRLATERAYGKVEGYKKPSPVREVDRPAKVGEYIKIVKRYPGECRYNVGDIFQVRSHSPIDGSVKVACNVAGRTHICTVMRYEYVVLEGYKPAK